MLNLIPILKWPLFAVGVILAVSLSGSPMASITTPTDDPTALYGEKIIFEVIRNGDPVGRQTVSFSKLPDGKLNVSVTLKLAVKFLGLNVYKYEYRSDAVWLGGQLIELKAIQEEDGESSEVTAVTANGKISLNGPAGKFTVQPGLFPTNHWNAGVLTSSRVINTLTGELSNVQIEKAGTESIVAQGRTIEATKYIYNGDVDPIVWYDRDGRWVKFRFLAKGNSLIEYRCLKCGLDDGPTATN